MPGRLARASSNYNSVRFKPPSIESRQALYQKLTPDPDWYTALQQEVAITNAAAINAVGREPGLRRDYLRPIHRSLLEAYPQYDTSALRSPEVASTIPIIRDAAIVDDRNAIKTNNGLPSGVNGFIRLNEAGNPEIYIDPNLSQGRQTKTVIHELAHNQLGHMDENIELSNPIKEFQAEAVARGVREKLGMLNAIDGQASAAYITGHLTHLAGSDITPKQLFATHYPAIASAVEQLAPIPAQPFKRMIPGLYSQFS